MAEYSQLSDEEILVYGERSLGYMTRQLAFDQDTHYIATDKRGCFWLMKKEEELPNPPHSLRGFGARGLGGSL